MPAYAGMTEENISPSHTFSTSPLGGILFLCELVEEPRQCLGHRGKDFPILPLSFRGQVSRSTLRFGEGFLPHKKKQAPCLSRAPAKTFVVGLIRRRH